MMNTNITQAQEHAVETRVAGSTPRAGNKRALLIAAAMLAAIVPAMAQAGGEQRLPSTKWLPIFVLSLRFR